MLTQTSDYNFLPTLMASILHDTTMMVDALTPGSQSTEDGSTIAKPIEVDQQSVQKLRDLTFVRTDLDGAVIDVDELRRRCPLDQSSASGRASCSNDRALTQSLSQLDRLPLETMQQILEDLDLQTLTNFRLVNQRAMSVIDSIPRYRDIITHIPDALRAMLSTKLARHFKLIHLYSELCSPDCFLCGSFGAFLFLPDCYRCCWTCLCEADSTLPISYTQAKESFELTHNALLQRPAMLTLPGSYGVGSKTHGPGLGRGPNKDGPTTYKSRTWLVGMWAARTAAVDLHDRQRIVDSYMLESRTSWTGAYERQDWRARRYCEPRRIAKPPFPPYIRGPNSFTSETRRFRSAIRFPTLIIGKIQWGVSCAGCWRHYGKKFWETELEYHEYQECQRMYTMVGFLRHMEVCKWARRMWKQISRPTYIKVHKEHVDPKTLDVYDLPWEWDPASSYHKLT